MTRAPVLIAVRRRRRLRRSAEEIAAILAKYRSSGLTQKAFAKSEGLSFSTLTSWLRRLRAGDPARAGRPPRLVRVNVTEPIVRRFEVAGAFELDFQGGSVLRMRIPQEFNGSALRDLLGILAERC